MSRRENGFEVYKCRDIPHSTRFPYRKSIYKVRTLGAFNPVRAILGVLNKGVEDYGLVDGDKFRIILATGEFSGKVFDH